MRTLHFALFCLLLLSLTSCRWLRESYWRLTGSLPNPIPNDTIGVYNLFSPSNFSYLDFPYEDTVQRIRGVASYCEGFADGGERWGSIVGGFKQGEWITGFTDYDSSGRLVFTKIYRQEYFKDGLRDSILNAYVKGKLVYSTHFKMGTGVLKAFHVNGQLYYEIATADGYFTDTLRLHGEDGVLQEKLYYIKDSLVSHQIFVNKE